MAPPSPPPSPRRSRGRPVEIDRDHLARVALRLFEERGYDAVSAAEVAAASGISRRSLFRYFPTKADLVWDRFGEGLEVLQDALARGEGDPVGVAVAALVAHAQHAAVTPVTRARLRIIAQHRELFAFGTSRLQDQSAILRAHLLEQGLDPLQARVAASALTITAFNGYVAWAVDDSAEHPAAVVQEALAVLALF